ncbi:hypothetical protein TNCV_3147961 [Trichonephila clavipes]|nr:hypothetical protein TNCV_3147961 [Trichonephila clavipes]
MLIRLSGMEFFFKPNVPKIEVKVTVTNRLETDIGGRTKASPPESYRSTNRRHATQQNANSNFVTPNITDYPNTGLRTVLTVRMPKLLGCEWTLFCGHLDCENSTQSHTMWTSLWEMAKMEFLYSAERHEGHWLKRGDSGGVLKILLLDRMEDLSA